jgi:hypothetical protein
LIGAIHQRFRQVWLGLGGVKSCRMDAVTRLRGGDSAAGLR